MLLIAPGQGKGIGALLHVRSGISAPERRDIERLKVG